MSHLVLLMALAISPNRDPRSRVSWDTTYEPTLTGDWQGLILRGSMSPAICYWYSASPGPLFVPEGGPLPTLYATCAIKLHDRGRADVILWGLWTHRGIYKTFGQRICICFDEEDQFHRPASFFDRHAALWVLEPIRSEGKK